MESRTRYCGVEKMKKATYIFKSVILFTIFYQLILNNSLTFENNLIILLIIAMTIFKEKYSDSVYTIALNFIIIVISIYFDRTFAILLAIASFDFMDKKLFISLIPIIGIEVYYFSEMELTTLLPLTIISGLFGYVSRDLIEKENTYKHSLDQERRLRYELEQMKAKLLQSSKEVAHLAEAHERNRIAREIHDSVGHKTAGILIQLQAAYKLFDKHTEKAKEVTYTCITALSETVTLLRDTVHNIKPKESLGLEYIQKIIDNFRFCPVNFKFSGDFSKVSPNQLEILGTNIKEALTNAAKHSKATEMDISIDINPLYVRLQIKDNGVGCAQYKEGMGLSGMKERIQNIGGSISIYSNNGFMIVCIIPAESNGEGELIENLNR